MGLGVKQISDRSQPQHIQRQDAQRQKCRDPEYKRLFAVREQEAQAKGRTDQGKQETGQPLGTVQPNIERSDKQVKGTDARQQNGHSDQALRETQKADLLFRWTDWDLWIERSQKRESWEVPNEKRRNSAAGKWY